MGFKLNVVLSTAVCFTVVNGLAINVTTDPNSNSEAGRLVQTLVELVNNSLSKAEQELDKLSNGINSTASIVTQTGKTKIQELQRKLLSEFNELKRKASQAAVDIQTCTEGVLDALNDLSGNMTNDMIHCVTDSVTEGVSYIQGALHKLQEIVNVTISITKDAKTCDIGFYTLNCLAQLVLEIEEKIITLPTQIAFDIEKTISLITRIEGNVRACAKTRITELTIKGERIVGKMSICVAKKMTAYK